MDIFTMHYNFENNYLVVIVDSIVYVYKIIICKFLTLRCSHSKQKIFLLVNQGFVL